MLGYTLGVLTPLSGSCSMFVEMANISTKPSSRDDGFVARLDSSTNISEEAQLNESFHYNSTPLAPPGTKAIINETPGFRGTWNPQGTKGWYIGGAPEHYRCWKIYVTKTAAELISDTVDFTRNNANYCTYHQNT